jgi:hypothetical protein
MHKVVVSRLYVMLKYFKIILGEIRTAGSIYTTCSPAF